MYNHAPKDYQCFTCVFASGQKTEYNKPSDIVLADDKIVAFLSFKWWINNPSHVIVIPREHFENIYDIPDALLSHIHMIAKKIAIAFKQVYTCDGTSIKQHNEPAGDQHLWHFHVHVLPRYENDNLYLNDNKTYLPTLEERLPYAEKLRKYFKEYHE